MIAWARYPSRLGGHDDKPFQLTYKKTAYDGPDQSGEIVIRSMAMDARQTSEWAKKLSVPYSGQSLGAFSVTVLDTLLHRRSRKAPDDRQKRELVAKQGGKCDACAEHLGDATEYDHITPLCRGGTNDPSNFQALCPQCHAEKTRGEGGDASGYMKSRFNGAVFRDYVMSPAPPCMTFKDAGAE